MAVTELSPAEKKAKAEVLLREMPSSFRWTINGVTYNINEFAELIKNGGASEETVDLVLALGSPASESQLGKRFHCLVCGTEILCTKAGKGTPQCCEQPLFVRTPKPVPSSD